MKTCYEETMSDDDPLIPGELCSSCGSINFKRAFALSFSGSSRGVAITDTRKDVQPDCILCSCVVARIFSAIETNDRVSAIRDIGYHFRALGSRNVSERPLNFHFRGLRTSDVVIAIVRGSSDLAPANNQLLEAISLGLILPLTHETFLQRSNKDLSYHNYKGRFVSSLHPDYTLIASWIDDCCSLKLSAHVNCRFVREDMGFQSRVINCWTREIVPLTRDLEYLALSYVWGRVTNDEDSQTAESSGWVPFNAPQTIEDAISAVLQIGKRYLWVDRYCIWQSENRDLQIQNMHEIYRNAVSTIVPVEADSAGSGFIGVSSPRCEQPRFWTNAGQLFYTFPHISYHLLSSVWLTRGWTYQEAFLSRSCIFFTKDQVYFVCRSTYESEAVEQRFSLSNQYQETLEPTLLGYADYLDVHRRPNDPDLFFCEHINAYTSRSLTLDSDGLNAFEGIIKSGHTKSIWGIVSYYSDLSELGFAVGLAWFGIRDPPGGGPIRRRVGFPTWSWVSLVDRIESAVKAVGTRNNLAGCSTFYVEDKSGQRLGIGDFYQSIPGSGALLYSDFGKALFIEANITQVRLVWSKKANIFSVHTSKCLFPNETGQSSSPLRVKDVRALIDDEDPGHQLNIESRSWSAVQLFWKERAEFAQYEDYWMLVDEREAIAHRIGLIAPVSQEGLWLNKDMRAEKQLIRMEDLEAQRRVIRIE